MRSHTNAPRRWGLLLVGLLVLLAIGGTYAQITYPRLGEPIPTDNLPPTKLAFLQMIDATQVAALTAIPTAPRDPNYRPRPTPRPKPTARTGISEGFQPPLPSEIYKISNEWDSNIGGYDVQVFAGQWLYNNPPQGVLVVVLQPTDGKPPLNGGQYLAPVPTGLLRIASFQGTKLTVVDTESNKQFLFDVTTRAWLTH
jgi:hypothetical protein